MIASLRKILSHECGPFWQFVKYGAIGVMATLVQTGVFYLFATTVLKCLTADDVAVRFLGFASVEGLTDGVRAFRFTVATAFGFVVANVFCWLMNRWFVFRSGKFRWWVEFGMFVGASTMATVIALGVSSALIRWCGLMTTLAVFIEIFVSFCVNFFVRKFYIFKG